MNVCKNMKLEVLKTLDYYPKLSFEEFHYSISQDQYYIVDHVPIISKVFKTTIVFLKQIKCLFCQCGS
jgi:hypothetical protein